MTEVRLSLLFQRKTLEPPLFELVLEIPKSHFKVREEIPVKLYLVNKSNYPITIVHSISFPQFLIYDEANKPIFGGLTRLFERFPVLRPGQPYYGYGRRAPLPQKPQVVHFWRVNDSLKIANLYDGFGIIALKPGVYTLKAIAEFEILDMKRYTNLISGGSNIDGRRVIGKKELFTQPFRVYIE